MFDLFTSVTADLRSAWVPVLPGSRWVWPEASGGGSVRIEDERHASEVDPTLRGDGCVPDLTDRATFLLCCDEAERRGIDRVSPKPGYVERLSVLRTLVWWGDTDRPVAIAALARALAKATTIVPDASNP